MSQIDIVYSHVTKFPLAKTSKMYKRLSRKNQIRIPNITPDLDLQGMKNVMESLRQMARIHMIGDLSFTDLANNKWSMTCALGPYIFCMTSEDIKGSVFPGNFGKDLLKSWVSIILFSYLTKTFTKEFQCILVSFLNNTNPDILKGISHFEIHKDIIEPDEEYEDQQEPIEDSEYFEYKLAKCIEKGLSRNYKVASSIQELVENLLCIQKALKQSLNELVQMRQGAYFAAPREIEQQENILAETVQQLYVSYQKTETMIKTLQQKALCIPMN
jgi:hypothetical protein